MQKWQILVCTSEINNFNINNNSNTNSIFSNSANLMQTSVPMYNRVDGNICIFTTKPLIIWINKFPLVH